MVRSSSLLGKFFASPTKKTLASFLNSSSAGAIGRTSNYLAEKFIGQSGYRMKEFLLEEKGAITDGIGALTQGKWNSGALSTESISSSSISSDSFVEFLKVLEAQTGGEGTFFYNPYSSVSENGHGYIFSGTSRPFVSPSEAINLIQSLGPENMRRMLVGSFPIGSQILTEAQRAACEAKFSQWRDGAQDFGQMDIWPDINVKDSEQYGLQLWNEKSPALGSAYLLGRGSIVTMTDTLHFEGAGSNGLIITGAKLSTLSSHHPLDGFAYHIAITDPVMQTVKTVVIGGGKHPSSIIDSANHPIANLMWMTREELFNVSVNHFDELVQASGSSSGILFNSSYLEAALDKASLPMQKSSRFLQSTDTLSPLVVAGKNKLSRFVEESMKPPSDEEKQAGDDFDKSGEFEGEGNPEMTDSPDQFENSLKE